MLAGVRQLIVINMKNFIKENWFRIVLLLISIVVLFLIFSPSNSSKDKEVKVSFTPVDLSGSKEITCTFPQTVRSHFIDNEIVHSLPVKEREPMINTFSKLDDPKIGQLSYIDSTRTITSVPVVKIMEDEEKIAYFDGGTENYTIIYYIYKKLGVATYTKSVSLLGIPSITGGMGSCIGY